MYTQKIDWSQYSKESQLYSSEKEFILAGKLNHNEDKLSLATIQDIFSIKSSSSEFATKAGKLLFLDKVKYKLKHLPYNTVELAKIRQFRPKAKQSCLRFKQYETQTSIKKSQNILNTVKPLLHRLDDPQINADQLKLNKMTCDQAKEAHSAYIIAFATQYCTEDVMSIGNQTMFIFQYFLNFVSPLSWLR